MEPDCLFFQTYIFANFTSVQFLTRFFNVTSDVLTSIKKTEDSLLRLKRIKKSEGTSVSTVAESGKMTDDDKIRLQFALDTEEFGRQVKRSECLAGILFHLF